jgi:hypothetical protein
MTEERNSIIPRQKMVWEIYVPTISNDGKPFRLRHHRVWDSRVHRITGGLTILTPCKGFWVDKEDEKLHNERMIPVRIVCSEKDIIRIMEITKEHYKQIDVLAYKISEQALFLSDLNK